MPGVVSPSLRTAPRRRRQVAPWLILMLTPLFRYSSPRDAWILRGVGEMRGPVLEIDRSHRAEQSAARPRGPGRWLTASTRPRPLATWNSRGLAVLIAAAAVAAGAFGLALGHGNAHAGGAPRLSEGATSSAVRISYPAGWRPVAPANRGLVLSDAIAVSAPGRGGGTLVVGRTSSSSPLLLPASLLNALPTPPVGRIVTLGHARLFRYLNLLPRGGPQPETIYALSTTNGVVLGVCVSRAAMSSFLGACERSLTTLRLRAGTALPPGPIPGYAAALSAAIKRLDAVRARIGSQLSTARRSRGQAQAADALAGAHTAAAAALANLSAGPASIANAAVASALALNGAAYLALARAATRSDLTGYDQARTLLRRAAVALQAAYLRLSAFGYRVG